MLLLQYPSLLIFFFFFFLLPPLSSTFNRTAECPDQCGDIIIPYPFGIGPKCSMGPAFDIFCNSTDAKPWPADNSKPWLAGTSMEVVFISLLMSQIRVIYPNDTAATCYNLSGSRLDWTRDAFIDLLSTPYTLSDDNWITAVGYDDVVTGIGSSSGHNFSGSCVAYSGFCPEYDNGYSLERGCCRIPIPRGTTTLRVSSSNLQGSLQRRKLKNCSYAIVGTEIRTGTPFSYPFEYLENPGEFLRNNLTRRDTDTYLAMDWRIGKENCSQASQLSTYACRENAFCVNFDANIGGYICRCNPGYSGNPYLSPGCQDVTGCLDAESKDCGANSICIKNPGQPYQCPCLKGYEGDGMISVIGSRGCIRKTKLQLIEILLIGLGSGMGLLLLLTFCFWSYKRYQKERSRIRRQKFFERNGGLLLQQQTNEGALGKPTIFPARELEKATDHFNETRILGQGGQGTVYKGMLSDGKIVAIKKSKLVDENQLEQFINEVAILSQINHRNVVKLLGCCLETEVPLLVYEFMPNGTLFDLIHDPSNEFPVSWDVRLKFASDVAGALAYLHYASSLPIYHRDIKSSNILLDEKYVVKVSDFGTSRSVAVDQTHLTTLVKGTFGYLDPEYFQSSQFTEKSDVYSFGVVLVELLTGQRAISMKRTDDDQRSLATRFLASMEASSLDAILDPQVLSEQNRNNEVIGVARIAHRCLNLKGIMRPTMKEVATELESLRMSQMSSTVRDESEQLGFREATTTMTITQLDYEWAPSGKSVASSSTSEAQPLMFQTVSTITQIQT